MRTGSDSSTATDRPVIDRRTAVAGVVVGLLGCVLSATGSGRPSFWYDEAATVSAVNRSYSQLFSLVSQTDGVHAAYYLVIKAWTSVFGLSEFAMRFPSALAVGAAAATMVLLGDRLAGRGFGIVAGVALLTIPRTMWAGSEARSYAGTLFVAVLVTLLVLVALDRGRWWWVAYGVGVLVAVIWFFLAITLLAAHAAYVLLLRRSAFREFAVAGLAALVVLSPFAWWVSRQRGQVSWIPQMSMQRAAVYLRFEFFDGTWVYPVVGAALVVLAASAAVVSSSAVVSVRVVILGVCWVAIPALVVFAVSWWGAHLYAPRYLVFTVPGLALLLSWAVVTLSRQRRWATVILVAALAAAAVPDYLAQRGPYGRTGGTDFSAVADYVGEHAAPGDCVAFDSAPSWSPISQRVVVQAAPADFVGLRDVGAQSVAAQSGRLWDVEKPISAYGPFARGCQVMWVITDGERDRRSTLFPGGQLTWYFTPFHFTDTELYRVLAATGLHITARTEFNHSQVVRMQR